MGRANQQVSEHFLRPLVKKTGAAHVIRNARSGQVVAHQLTAAFDSKTRRTGLLRHDSFADGSAMVIAPSNAVHTFFMRFPIDVAFVNRQGKVVKTYAALAPWRIAAALGAFAVIELPAGTLARTDTVRGDLLSIGVDGQV